MVTLSNAELVSLSLSIVSEVEAQREHNLNRQTPPYWATQQNRIDLDNMNADRTRHYFGWERI